MAVITLGSAATDRAGASATATIICEESPASTAVLITSVSIWANTNLSGCIVATFYNTGGNDFTARDSHSIGVVVAGKKRTFSVNLIALAGDYIGIYFSGGQVDVNTGGGQGLWYGEGDLTSGSDTYYHQSTWVMSLYGTGTVFSYTGSGSLGFSGTATQSYTFAFAYVGAGGLTYSGTATQVYTKDFLYTGSGAYNFSGTATQSYTFAFAYVGAGGLTYSGTATQSYTFAFAYVATGDITFSGTAIYSWFADAWISITTPDAKSCGTITTQDTAYCGTITTPETAYSGATTPDKIYTPISDVTPSGTVEEKFTWVKIVPNQDTWLELSINNGKIHWVDWYYATPFTDAWSSSTVSSKAYASITTPAKVYAEVVKSGGTFIPITTSDKTYVNVSDVTPSGAVKERFTWVYIVPNQDTWLELSINGGKIHWVDWLSGTAFTDAWSSSTTPDKIYSEVTV